MNDYTPTNHDHEYECDWCRKRYEVTEEWKDKDYCSTECHDIFIGIIENKESCQSGLMS